MNNPEDVVRAAFAAFRSRDGDRLAQLSTIGSLRRFAQGLSHRDIDEAEARATLESAIARIPASVAEAVRCIVIGHVADGANTVHVVFHLLFEAPNGTTLHADLLIATTERDTENSEWKFVLDELAHAGMPGFRAMIWGKPSTAT
jgi:hypothetical protein